MQSHLNTPSAASSIPSNTAKPGNSPILIVGAATAGLSVALALAKKGVKNIIIADPRLGTYFRSTNFIHEVFVEFGEFLLGPSKIIPHSSSHAIKELERDLYARLKLTGITCHKAKFKILSEDVATLIDEDGSELKFPVSMLLDCSGPKRVVLNEINRLNPENPIFITTNIGSHPHQHFLQARIKMQPSSRFKYNKMVQNLPNFPVCKHFILARETLRELGWDATQMPLSYINWGRNLKGNFYTEAPSQQLTEDQQKIWVKSVIAMSMQGHPEDFSFLPPSKKYPSKHQISAFTIKPNQVTPAYHKRSDNTFIFHFGDATATTDFQLAEGATNSLKRIKHWLDALNIVNGDITAIDLQQYDTNIATEMTQHRQSILNLQKVMSERFSSAKPFDYIPSYQTALGSSVSDFERKTIASGLKFLEVQQALIELREIKEGLNNILDIHGNVRINELGVSQKLFECRDKLLSIAAKVRTQEYASELYSVKVVLMMLAKHFTAIAQRLFHEKNYGAARQFCKEALLIFNKFFKPNIVCETTSELYLIKIQLALHLKSYDEASDIMRLVDNDVLLHMSSTSLESFEAKMLRHHATSLMGKMQLKETNQEAKEKILKTLSNIIKRLDQNNYARQTNLSREIQENLEAQRRKELWEKTFRCS